MIREREIPIVLLGEKDHGKSTLLGRIMYETKSVPESRIAELRAIAQKSGKRFEWAHLMDSFQYERERKMTLDTTRAKIKIGKFLYEFIDVPGHKSLIKNMLSGASTAKYGILIVAADESIKPQTKKHLEIATFLGVEKIIAVINKCDKIKYSLPKFIDVKAAVEKSAEEAGFKNFPIVPVSAYNGTNLLKPLSFAKKIGVKTLAETILSFFKPSGPEKNKPFSLGKLQAQSKFANAECLWLKNPAGNSLVLKSGRDQTKILKIRIRNFKILTPRIASLELENKIALEDKFVIKHKGHIIGLCRAF